MVVAVIVDAVLIRAVLVPAVMRVAGDWNWWRPATLAKVYRWFGIRD